MQKLPFDLFRIEKKKSLKLRFYRQVEAYEAQRKTVILVFKFLFQIRILPAPLMLLLVTCP